MLRALLAALMSCIKTHREVALVFCIGIPLPLAPLFALSPLVSLTSLRMLLTNPKFAEKDKLGTQLVKGGVSYAIPRSILPSADSCL